MEVTASAEAMGATWGVEASWGAFTVEIFGQKRALREDVWVGFSV